MSIPDPPDWLSGEALAEWPRITAHLEKLGLISKLDRAALTAYCQNWELNAWSQAVLAEQGYLAPTGAGGVKKHPAATIGHDAREQMRRFLTEFGMTPSSRSRMAVAPSSAMASTKPDRLKDFDF